MKNKTIIITDYRNGVQKESPKFVSLCNRKGIPKFPFKATLTGKKNAIGYEFFKAQNGFENNLMYFKHK